MDFNIKIAVALILLLDIPRVRTGIEKLPYWPVYGIKMLARMGAKSQSTNT